MNLIDRIMNRFTLSGITLGLVLLAIGWYREVREPQPQPQSNTSEAIALSSGLYIQPETPQPKNAGREAIADIPN